MVFGARIRQRQRVSGRLRQRLAAGLLAVSAALLLLWAVPAQAGPDQPAPPLTLTEAPASTDLAPHTRYRCEADPALTAADVRGRPFAALPDGKPAFGYQDGTCWFRVTLRNAGAAPLDLMLLLDFGLPDHVALYLPGPDGDRILRAGDAEPFSERPIQTRLLAFPLTLAAGQEQELLLSVRSMNSLYVPLRIAGEEQFLESVLPREWLIGVFYGIGVGLLIYNFLLWVSLRERAHLYYVAYVGLTMLVFAGWHGAYLQWFGREAALSNLAHQNFVFLAMMFSALLLREFLETRQWRLAEWLIGGLVLVVVLCMAAPLVVPAGNITRMQGAVAVLAVLIALGIGIVRWRQGMAGAGTYVMAWLLYLVAVVVVVLATYNITSWSAHMVEGLQAAMVLQHVMLAWGLTQRLSALKNEALQRERAVVLAQAESAAKGEFLARMSHEIRTPLNAVIGIAQLLREAPPPQVQKDYVEALNNAGHSLLNLVNDILDHSRISSGKVELELVSFDLHALIDQCVAIFALSARQKSLALTLQRAEDVPRWVYGDPNRLRQILLNLLGNAIKFTDRGHVYLRILRHGDVDAVRLQFEVEDTGIGIDAAQIDRLFQSFEQADTSTSRVYGGSGLGLAISRQLVELMGGNIGVRSTPGRGSCFYFTVRLGHGEPLVTPASTPLPVRGLDRLRVLVAEDNPVNQMVIDGFLRRIGIEAQMVGNGEEAVQAVLTTRPPFDVLLLDCEMPRLDGFGAARHIREHEARTGTGHLPIIAMTAHALAESRERCVAAGMDDHLGKPLTLEQLIAMLQRWARR